MKHLKVDNKVKAIKMNDEKDKYSQIYYLKLYLSFLSLTHIRISVRPMTMLHNAYFCNLIMSWIKEHISNNL